MATLQPTSADTWETFTWKMFAMFMLRQGWTIGDINEEKIVLKTAGATPTANSEKLTQSYYRISRIGAHRRLTRAERQGVLLTYSNACNHASIHFE